MTTFWRKAWDWMRTLVGDDAYERYLLHHARHHPERAPMSAQDFYLSEQQRKWTGVSRCC